MKKTISVVLASLLLSVAAMADMSDVKTEIRQASNALEDLMSVKETSIPTDLLKAAKCVANIKVIQGGFIFGAKGGSGVASCRTANGTWGAPLFLNLGSLSWGLQIGVESVELTLVFTNRDAVESLAHSNFTLDGHVGLTAGPVGRDATAGTNYKLEDAVYSYSRSKGAYAGLTIEGSVLDSDDENNAAVYGSRRNGDILGSTAIPAVVSNYTQTLTKFAK